MRHKAAWSLISIATVASGVGAVVAAGSADATPRHAASSPSAAKEFFYVTSSNGKETVVAHGLFTGGGKDEAGVVKDVLHLGGGTLTLLHPGKGHTSRKHIDHATCYATLRLTGKYTLGKGTGKYAGVTGSGTYTVSVQAILKRTSSGSCDKQSKPKVEADAIKASGPATMP
jgi:hypothetical protein